MPNEKLANQEDPVKNAWIPAKRFFTLGEVLELCRVKAHVLRYWEQEFPQLRAAKRRVGRRYYRPHDVLLIRKIRNLLYEQGFSIGRAIQHLETSPDNKTESMEVDETAYAESKLWLESIADDLEEDFAHQESSHKKQDEIFSTFLSKIGELDTGGAK